MYEIFHINHCFFVNFYYFIAHWCIGDELGNYWEAPCEKNIAQKRDRNSPVFDCSYFGIRLRR